MTRERAEALFREAFVEVKGSPPPTVEIKDTVSLIALDIDSLDLIEMMMVASELSHRTILDTAMSGVETVRDVIDALMAVDATV